MQRGSSAPSGSKTDNRPYDTVIVGGGIMGCTIALSLATRGQRVLVLERSVPGAEASSAAAGILGPALEAHGPGLQLTLGLESREAYASLARELADITHIDVGYRRCGAMVVAFDEAEAQALAERHSTLRGLDVSAELVDGARARMLEPHLSPDVTEALLLADEAQVDPRRLLRALAIAAERRGATFRTGAIVERIAIAHDSVAGVRVAGELVHASNVVVAAGSWTSLVAGLGIEPDAVRPVRGQIVAVETRAPLLSRIVFGAGGYVVPRADGRTLCGSTMEEVGFEREVTLGGVASVTRTALRLAPSLAGARLQETWSSFRPATRDTLPLLGELDPRGLFLATGHFRNGILLAPITAKLVTALVLRESPHLDIRALSPKRLARGRTLS